MPHQHQVRQGECIFSIANQYGHKWEAIWDAPANQELREQRGHPGVLRPGDQVWIPDPRRVKLASRQRHVVTVPRNLVTLRLRIMQPPPPPSGDPASADASRDHRSLTVEDPPPPEPVAEEPRSDTPWQVWIGEELVTSGTSDGDGYIEVKLEPQVTRAQLVVDPGAPRELRVPLVLGGLDPLDTISGVKQRLYNLGFDCGDVTDEVHENLAAVLTAFQEAHGLEPTGEIDDETRDRLADLHGL